MATMSCKIFSLCGQSVPSSSTRSLFMCQNFTYVMGCYAAGYLYLGGDLYYYFACGFVGCVVRVVLCKRNLIDNSIVMGSVSCYHLASSITIMNSFTFSR